jgi:hypothetical protein
MGSGIQRHEPLPEPKTPKEGVIHPLEFPIKFEDHRRTLNLLWHKENISLSKEVSPNTEPSKEWLMEVKCSSEAIQILSPSMTMNCLLKGTSIEALHNLIVGTNIISQFLAETLLGNIPLVLADRLFKSPSRLIFECCGIARAVPIEIHETEVFLDFHIYAILDFDLLIGYPLEKLFKEKPSHGSLNNNLGTASAIHNPSLKNQKAKQQPNHNMFVEVKLVSPFISPKLACETERIPSPLLEHKPCPSGKSSKNFCA